MIFDSQQQKAQVIALIGEVPVTTTVGELMQGIPQEIVELQRALTTARVLSPKWQARLEIPGEDMED